MSYVDFVETKRKLFSNIETAKLLGISLRTLWTLTNSGQIKCVRIGRLVKFSDADIDAYIEKARS